MPEKRAVDSKVYDRTYYQETDGAHYFFNKQVAPKFFKALDRIGLKTNQKVLDIGCGRGDLLIALAGQKAHAIGVDYSNDALSIAQEAIADFPDEIRNRIQLINSDATGLGFPDRIFDAVFLMDIVEHLYPDQLQTCFKECRRVLKDEGRLVVHTSPNRWYNDFGYPLWERPLNRVLNSVFRQNFLTRPIRTEMDIKVHVNEQTVLSLNRALKQAGFSPKVWLGKEYVLPVKKDNTLMQFLEFCRQVVCHGFPFSLVPPLNFLFSNDIWAIGKKS